MSMVGTRPSMKGMQCGHAKLTDDQVREIRTRRNGGEAARALSKEFGISKAQCFRIISKENWSHVI